MIVYVDIEHDRVKEMGDKWDVHLQRVLNVKYRLEEISGDHCLVMRYQRVNPEVLRELKVRAVLVSGNMTEFQHYDEANLAGLRAMFREGAQPTLGFCGGCQMMAQTFGVNVGAIIPAEAGDMDDESWRNRTHEWGFTPVQQLRPHPLFAGLAPQMNLFEAHYWEVKQLPKGFENLGNPLQRPVGSDIYPGGQDMDHVDPRCAGLQGSRHFPGFLIRIIVAKAFTVGNAKLSFFCFGHHDTQSPHVLIGPLDPDDAVAGATHYSRLRAQLMSGRQKSPKIMAYGSVNDDEQMLFINVGISSCQCCLQAALHSFFRANYTVTCRIKTQHGPLF